MDYTSAYQRAMTGDQEGFRFLYDSTAQPVYEFLLTQLGDQPKADQMIGKVYEQAWANLRNLANPEEFPGWVYSIAENMVTQEKGSIPVPPIGGGEAAGASSGNALAGGEAGITPNASHMSSPNAAHMSPNAAHASSPNVANMADGGIQQMSAGATGGQGVPGSNLASAGNQIPGSNLASVGSNAGKGVEAAATGSKAGVAGVKTAAAAGSSGAKATFLSTAIGKVILGVGIAATATALGVGGYFIAKKINHKDEPTTESTEISSAEIETEASTDVAVTTEATTEAASTEEAKIDVHQLYVIYMNDVLIPERGVHKAEQDKTSSGMSNEGTFSELPGWFDGSGIYIADFDDYDGDGEEEMLVVSGEAFPMDGYYADYTENQYRMKLEMYDIRDEKVVLRDACETGYIYDGYEGGGFPYTLAKVKRNSGIFLFSIAAGGLSYRTDASTNASYKIYSTKEELRSLYELGFKCALGGGYKITCVDRRSDPSNNNEVTLVDTSGQVDKNTSELTTGDDLKLPLYKEEVPNYFADWNIQLNDDFEVSDGTILMKMYIDYNNRKYHLIDNSGFHDADWVTAKKEEPTTQEPTTEEAKVETGAVLPFEGTLSFNFASGAGAWWTDLDLEPNGHFSGEYHDTNAGESGDGYDATVYWCDFEGQFKNITKIDDYTYRMELDYYTTEKPVDTEEMVDNQGHNIRYIYTEPYGIANGNTFYFYLPGKPISELDDAFLSWGYGSVGYNLKDDVTMKQYGIFNEAEGQGLFTFKEE